MRATAFDSVQHTFYIRIDHECNDTWINRGILSIHAVGFVGDADCHSASLRVGG